MAEDSVLAVFGTAAGAVTAALAIQAQVNALTEADAENRRVRFETGPSSLRAGGSGSKASAQCTRQSPELGPL